MNSGRTIFLLIMDYPLHTNSDSASSDIQTITCNHGYDPQSKLLDIIPRLYGIIRLTIRFQRVSLNWSFTNNNPEASLENSFENQPRAIIPSLFFNSIFPVRG